jgi:hypothetical protein
MVPGANRITIAEACVLLGVTRPTLNVYRKKYRFKEIREGRRIFFSRQEILSKCSPKVVVKTDSFIITDDTSVETLLVSDEVFDLRKIKYIDPHGILSLLCLVLTKAKEGKTIQLLVEDSFQIQRMHSLGFFFELERKYPETVVWDRSKVRGLPGVDTDTFLPIQYVGSKGGERQSAEDLARLLIKHGFSEEIGARIGWIFGELADNALTHSKGPCYLMCQRFVAVKKDDFNFLAIAVADLGVGIDNSLRSNEKYSGLDNKTAFLSAFKSSVSSWSDSFNRGKGLTDVIKIALGNDSYFRAESGAMGFIIPWDRKDRWVRPMCSVSGTRYSIVLTDNEFRNISREIADDYVEKLLKTL